jgi:hypothetical protein
MFIKNLVITVRMILFLSVIFACIDSLAGNKIFSTIKTLVYKKLRREYEGS